MLYIKRLSKIIFVISIFLLFVPTIKEIKLEEEVDKIINVTKQKGIYEGFISIPRFNYSNLIKKGEESLDNNLVELLSFSDDIGESNIILAGHNNRYVFNKLYYLTIGDEIIISDFNTDYKYIVKEMKYINVDDYSIFNNTDSLTLITCTYDNQKRYVVISKREL